MFEFTPEWFAHLKAMIGAIEKVGRIAQAECINLGDHGRDHVVHRHESAALLYLPMLELPSVLEDIGDDHTSFFC
jgi:hypothetical protein